MSNILNDFPVMAIQKSIDVVLIGTEARLYDSSHCLISSHRPSCKLIVSSGSVIVPVLLTNLQLK